MRAQPAPGLRLPAGLTSLIEEDLQAIPSGVLAAAQRALAANALDLQASLDACLAALAAGEPKRALDFLREGKWAGAPGRGQTLPWGRLQAAIMA
jgi:hypothetical protein